eukprot:gnl/Chilomastix_cuspidata/3106.p1 GENE.gnl/Chilomastix_cuspidata/3106~~gnl/Chilomastix_cuspidata/3106.p1  ORF type:complete len:798 (-),score=330.59 gnl/Chilomastix_cuspidata/3106:1583-3976(-)
MDFSFQNNQFSYALQNNVLIPTFSEKPCLALNLSEDLVKERFYSRVFDLHSEHGYPLKKLPIIGGKKLNIYQLFVKVQQKGGLNAVIKRKLFKSIGKELQIPPSVTNVGYVLKTKYTELILPFEKVLCDEFGSCGCESAQSDPALPLPRHAAPPPRAPAAVGAGPAVHCPGCGRFTPLGQFQSHLFSCNLDFYLNTFGAVHPDVSHMSRIAMKQAILQGTRSYSLDLARFEDTTEVNELLHLVAQKIRLQRQKAGAPRSSAVRPAKPTAQNWQYATSHLPWTNDTNSMINFPRKASADEAPELSQGADEDPPAPAPAAAATTAESLGAFMKFYIEMSSRNFSEPPRTRIDASPVADPVLLESQRFHAMASAMFRTIEPALIPPLIAAWPFATLPIARPHSSLVTQVPRLCLSRSVRKLVVDSVAARFFAEKFPASAGGTLEELHVSNAPGFSKRDLCDILHAYPRLRTLFLHPTGELNTWPEEARSAGRAAYEAAAARGLDAIPPPTPEACGHLGAALRELVLVDLHPFFNLGMLAEATPHLERCRLSYSASSPSFLPNNRLREQHFLRVTDFCRTHPAGQRLFEWPALPLNEGATEGRIVPVLWRDGPVPVGGGSSSSGSSGGEQPGCGETRLEKIAPLPLEPTFHSLFPQMRPQAYGLAPLRRLTYLFVEGAVSIACNGFARWTPNIEAIDACNCFLDCEKTIDLSSLDPRSFQELAGRLRTLTRDFPLFSIGFSPIASLRIDRDRFYQQLAQINQVFLKNFKRCRIHNCWPVAIVRRTPGTRDSYVIELNCGPA